MSGDALTARSKRTSVLSPLNAFDAAMVERAKLGASRKLQNPRCLKVLTDFRDGQGLPLQVALEERGVGAAEYLRIIEFLDGSSRPPCRRSGVEMVTSPGVPRVFVCGRFSNITRTRDPFRGEYLVIHEMLHTLGLGENPPTSVEITQQVKNRCQ